jgi:hypothetical protein
MVQLNVHYIYPQFRVVERRGREGRAGKEGGVSIVYGGCCF